MNDDLFGNSPAPKEPSADFRAAARALREYYLALVAEGFSKTEALVIIGQSINSGGSK